MAWGELYIKLITTFPKDPKVRALARYGADAGLARDLYVQMCLYCKEMLSDGFVPAEEIGLLVYPLDPEHGNQLAKQLASVGLTKELSKNEAEGWQVLAYVKRNGTREDTEQLSKVRAEAGRTGGTKSRKRPAQRVAKANGKQVANQVADMLPSNPDSDSVSENQDRVRVIQTPTVSAGEAGGGLTITQRSKRLTDAFAEAEPMCKWPAVNGVVIKAIKSERFSDDEIGAALTRLAAEGRSVTVDTLRTELQGFQADRQASQGRPNGTRQTSFSDEEYTMAGNQEHEAALRKAYPDAAQAECDGGPGRWATLTYADGNTCTVKCTGCEQDEMVRRIGAFIPPRFRGAIGMPEDVMNWVGRGEDAEGLYLAGPVGTGKTHTAWSAVGHWCLATKIMPRTPRTDGVEGWSSAGPAIIFTRMTDLLDDLRPGDFSRQRVRDCQNARLLVIDDVGAEKASEWTQERLYTIIDHRYANCLPLLVTGNLPPAKLAEQTGERTASRLAEMCQVVPITGDDRRRRPAA